MFGDLEISKAKTGKVGDVEEVLKWHTCEDWSKRDEGKVGSSRLPPKWLAELSKVVKEAITIWEIIVDWWEMDIAL